ncbi:MAG: hypothetical protein Q8O05_03005, partial [Chloroflexota bacterium]|nr:hypothetical protein [Chloroflexota bacterium]
ILPAKVTSISPTATIASGVVNYQVKVELQSTTPLPPRQSSSGQTPSTSGQFGGQRSPSASGRLPSVQTAAPQLREGLSVTVNIPIVQKSNIVLVPTRAIIRQGQQITVQVIKNSVIESRIITTGISNNQYTEVTEGLSEGEKVVIQASTTGTTTSPNRSPVIIPGMGGFGR